LSRPFFKLELLAPGHEFFSLAAPASQLSAAGYTKEKWR